MIAVPTQVTGLDPGVKAVSAGGWHTCAITFAGGVSCWGSNSYGQLGDGTTVSKGAPTPVHGLDSGIFAISAADLYTCAVTSEGGATCWGSNISGELGDGSTTNQPVPVVVWGPLSDVAAISAEGGHTCALISDGTARCWGSNGVGKLGNGTSENSLVPVQVLNFP